MDSSKSNLLVMLIVVYFLFFDTHFQMPVLASFARSLDATPFLVGMIVGIYSFFNIFGNMISGRLVDIGYGKKLVTGGVLAIALCLFFYAQASTPFTLLTVRSLHGLAGGLVIPVTLVHLTGNSLKNSAALFSKRISFYGAAVGMASLSAPPLAGILASFMGYERTYMAIAILMLLPAVLIVFFFKENRGNLLKEQLTPRQYYHCIINSPLLKLAYRLVFVLMGATGTLVSFFPEKAENLGASPAVTGGLFAAFAATAVIVHLFWPLLISRFNLLDNVKAGFALLLAALLLVNYLDSLPALFFAISCYGVGFGLLFPSLLEMVAGGSQPEWRGIATGVFFVFFSLGVALVSPLAGFLQQSGLGISPFLSAAGVSLAVMATALRLLNLATFPIQR